MAPRTALTTRRPRTLSAMVMVVAICVGGCGGTFGQGPSDALRSYARALEEQRVEDAYRMLSDEAKRSISLEAFRRMVLENPQDVMEVARALARPASDPVVKATVTLPNGEELALVYEDGRWRIDAAAVDLYGQSTPRQALAGFLRAFERKRYDVVLRYVPDAEREGVAPSASTSSAPKGPSNVAISKSSPPSAAPPAAPAPPPGPAAPAPVTSLADLDGGELTPEKLRAAWEGPQKEEMLRITQALRAALPSANIEETGDVATMSYGSGGTVSLIRERGAWKIRDF